jgi:hypothetical protein
VVLQEGLGAGSSYKHHIQLPRGAGPTLAPQAPPLPLKPALTLCNLACPPACRWPHSPTFKGKGFESAVQMVAVLPILVVAYLCQMSLGHTVSQQRQLGAPPAAAGAAAHQLCLLGVLLVCCSNRKSRWAMGFHVRPPACCPLRGHPSNCHARCGAHVCLLQQVRDLTYVRERQVDNVSIVALR